MTRLLEELRHLAAQAAHFDTQLQVIAQSDETAQRLMTIPGIGALIATALMAAVGEDVGLFRNGRALAAWLGLVPRAFHRRARAPARDQQAR